MKYGEPASVLESTKKLQAEQAAAEAKKKQEEKNRQSSTEVITSQHLINMVLNTIDMCESTYKKLLDSGVAKECARMILPMCSKTKIYMSGSIRSWIHFLEIRDDEHAQLEIQLIAKEIKKLFKEQLPIISKALNY